MSWLTLISSVINTAFSTPPLSKLKAPANLIGARVSYSNDGRSGRVIFSRGLRSFDMYYEFGGGDTVALIDIPTAEEWTAKTWFALEMRQPVLEFIAQSVVRDQTTRGKGRYVIHADHISIHV